MSDDESSLVEAREGGDRVARFERALGTLLLVGGAGGAVVVGLWLAWLLG